MAEILALLAHSPSVELIKCTWATSGLVERLQVSHVSLSVLFLDLELCCTFEEWNINVFNVALTLVNR